MSNEELLSEFEMESLKQKRKAAELTMIHDLLSGRVQDIILLPLIMLKIPTFNRRYDNREGAWWPSGSKLTSNPTNPDSNYNQSMEF